MLDNKTIDMMIMFIRQEMKKCRDDVQFEKMNEEICRLVKMKNSNK